MEELSFQKLFIQEIKDIVGQSELEISRLNSEIYYAEHKIVSFLHLMFRREFGEEIQDLDIFIKGAKVELEKAKEKRTRYKKFLLHYCSTNNIPE
jgi:hypothetical protein